MKTIKEAEPHMEALLDRLDRLWRLPQSSVRQMNDAERDWALRQSFRATFVELYGRDDGERRWAAHMAAAARGALQ